jgi:hypothetical protein
MNLASNTASRVLTNPSSAAARISMDRMLDLWLDFGSGTLSILFVPVPIERFRGDG